jgi:mevalonate pyrophosphate decarboxylase
MRLRKVQGKLKVEHSILDGLRNVLERLLNNNPAAIRSIIPGVIRPVRDAKGAVKIRVTVPTTNGWKAIALSAGARQELFISTSLSKDQLERAIRLASGSGDRAY